MARTHARVKGKSGSRRPVSADLSFVNIKAKEVEKLIVKMAKDEDKRQSEIGLILRDTYGVPSVKKLTGKSVSQILEEAKVSFNLPENLQALVIKANGLKKHLESNTRDTHNKRGMQLIESKIRRLSGYYKKKGKIPMNWRAN
jgi:small subunit ribosomal protein S15